MPTADGKITTARLTAGTRVYVTTDRMKSAGGVASCAVPTVYVSRVKRGATVATVTAAPQPMTGARTVRYAVTTDAGTVYGLTGAQTWTLAPDAPADVDQVDAPAAAEVPTCTDPTHLAGTVGCAAIVRDCQGIPARGGELADMTGAEVPAAHAAECGTVTIGREFGAAVARMVPDVSAVKVAESDPYMREQVRSFTAYAFTAYGHPVHVVSYSSRGPLERDGRRYLALYVAGDLVAGDLDAHKAPRELGALVGWRVRQHIAARVESAGGTLPRPGDVPAVAEVPAAPATEVPAAVDQVDAPAEVPAAADVDQVDVDTLAERARVAALVAAGGVAVTEATAEQLATRTRVPTLAGKDVATEVRRTLGAVFPGVRFSVRSEYNTVNIRWTDGPTTDAVDAVARQFRGSYPDQGGDGGRDYRGALALVDRFAVRVVELATCYVFTSRELSPEILASVAPMAAQYAGRPVDSAEVFRDGLAGPLGVWPGEFRTGADLVDWIARTMPAGWRDERSDVPACGAPGRDGVTCELAAGHPYPLIHRGGYRRTYVAAPAVAEVPAPPAAEVPADVDQVDAPAEVPARSGGAVTAGVRDLIARGSWSTVNTGTARAPHFCPVMTLPRDAGRLDRETYQAVRETLERVARGRWSKRARGFIFPAGTDANPWNAGSPSGTELVAAWLERTDPGPLVPAETAAAPAVPCVAEVGDTVRYVGKRQLWTVSEVFEGGARYLVGMIRDGERRGDTVYRSREVPADRLEFVRKGNALDESVDAFLAEVDAMKAANGGSLVPAACRAEVPAETVAAPAVPAADTSADVAAPVDQVDTVPAAVRPRCVRAVPAPSGRDVDPCNAPASAREILGPLAGNAPGAPWCTAHADAEAARGYRLEPLTAAELGGELEPAHRTSAEREAAEAAAPPTPPVSSPRVHRFESTGQAYNASQTDDGIRDGDVLIVESERVAGFLHRAWPTAVTAERGEFHAPDGDPVGLGFHGGRYAHPVRIAREIAAGWDNGPGNGPAPTGPDDQGPADGTEVPAAPVDLAAVIRADVDRARAAVLSDVARFRAAGATAPAAPAVAEVPADADQDAEPVHAIEAAHAAGRAAYADDRPRVPAADATVVGLVDGWPVGGGASDVFASFLRGFDTAADEAAAAVLAEVPAGDDQVDAPAGAGRTLAEVRADIRDRLDRERADLVGKSRAAGVAERAAGGPEHPDDSAEVKRIMSAVGPDERDDMFPRIRDAYREGYGTRGDAAPAVDVDAPAPAADVAADASAEPAEGDDQGDADADPWEHLAGPAADDAVFILQHSHEGGTEVVGSGRGDGVWEVLKRYGRARSWNGRLYLQHTRDKFGNADWLRAIGADLAESTGHTVCVRLDNDPRTAAEREADRAERAAARAERYETWAASAAGKSEAARLRAQQIGDRIPFGEPIKIGHHSERAHRRAFENIDAGMRKSFELADKASHHAHRAAAAVSTEEAKRDPRAMIRRAERLEADLRVLVRRYADAQGNEPHADTLSGRRLSMLREEIGHIRAQLEEMRRAGTFVAWSRDDFTPGDYANVRGRWCRVVRANAKSLSVPWWGTEDDGVSKPAHTDTVPYDRIHGRRRDGWQSDTPDGTPWPVADAQAYARWAKLDHAMYHGRGEWSDRNRAALAVRIAYGLPADASDREIAAIPKPGVGTPEYRARAIFCVRIFDRLAAGESADQVRADVTPIGTEGAAWTMPEGPTERRRVDQLGRGDVIRGWIDRGGVYGLGSGDTLRREFCGPVANVSDQIERHERGQWRTVQLEDGDEKTFPSHTWFEVYPASGSA